MRSLNGTLVLLCALLIVLLTVSPMFAPMLAQSNAVDLSGQALDPQSAAVVGAKVTVTNLATRGSRTVDTNDEGSYTFVGLPPGRYELSIEKPGFGKLVNPELVLTIGQAAHFDGHLTIQSGTQVVTVTDSADLIETRRTAVSETVDTRQIENLPINGRNYVNFTLINSQAARDSAPSIGAAPTSGLNFGGQRARSNQVSVDGADAGDNSVNGIRSTVSQEAVQEFQLIISNYMPEFGRATGGVINIVTKGGSNEVHGDVFGFLRHKSLQARNPFSVRIDPLTGNQVGIKQAYTRAQYGATLGGPIKTDNTFYFLSYEGTRRHETGFTDIGGNNFDGSSPVTGLTATQAAALAAFPANVQAIYTGVAASSSLFARTGIDPGLISGMPGAHFPLPVSCAPLTLSPIPCGPGGVGLAPRPASFVPLSSLIGNYPIKEATSLWSARIDHIWNSQNSSLLRVNVSPSLVTGIQVNAQNQNFGQNAGSRTSLNQYRDLAIVAQHTTSFTSNLLNEFRFQFARRGLHYGFSQLPGGDQVAVNITGFAFFGREPFSTVDRIERRFQWTDNVTYVLGHHTLKTGVDTNLIQLRSKKTQIFELNFGGIFNFGSIGADNVVNGILASMGMPGVSGLPQFSAIQAYGLGLPQNFIQGVGNSNSPLDNKALGLFVQDSWRMSPRFTVNYGVRYDIEFTPTFTPANATNAAAEKALGVLEGIPVFHKGIQPRIGVAWDPWGDGKTVVRGGFGITFDRYQSGITGFGATNPPFVFTPTLQYGYLKDITPGGGGLLSPSAISGVQKNSDFPTIYSYSIGVQRNLGAGTVVDVAYVGNQSRHLARKYNLNAPAYGTTFKSAAQDPTKFAGGVIPATDPALPAAYASAGVAFAGDKILPSTDFLRPYQGYGDITFYNFDADATYNSLQVSAHRRFSKESPSAFRIPSPRP